MKKVCGQYMVAINILLNFNSAIILEELYV